MPKQDHYAVFGHPIKHSQSPHIHQLFAAQTGQNIRYTAEDVPAENFTSAVNIFLTANGKGLNCTVPLKELAWELADHKTPRAELSKAVNTLALQDDGSILGDNTDGIGLVKDLTINNQIALKDLRILVLGAGGASRGIIGPLLECRPASLAIANRTLSRALTLAQEFSALGPVSGSGFEDLSGMKFDLILNATSTSLSNQLPPLPKNILAAGGTCYDLAYAQEATAFVRWGRANQAVNSLDGLGMLVEQAAEAFTIWRGIRPETKVVIAELNAERPTLKQAKKT